MYLYISEALSTTQPLNNKGAIIRLKRGFHILSILELPFEVKKALRDAFSKIRDCDNRVVIRATQSFNAGYSVDDIEEIVKKLHIHS